MASSETSMLSESLDKTTNILWVDPSALAEADQEFLIYSPSTKSYLFMSKDPTLSHSMHTKVEAHEIRLFERNLFKLEKANVEDTYYLLNLETGKHVYVSGKNVLGVNDNPADHPKSEKFQYSFEKANVRGLYTIKNQDSFLHVSSVRAGIPACCVIKASRDQPSIFQFVLVKDVRDAKIEYDTEHWEEQVKEIQDLLYEYPNEGEEEISKSVVFEEPQKEKDLFQFEHGFEYTGTFNGGVPGRTVTEDGDKKLIVFGSIMSTSSTRESGISNVKHTLNFKVAPGRKAVASCTLTESLCKVPFCIEVKTRSKKMLKGKGTWIGGSIPTSAYYTKIVSLEGKEDENI